jgi:hypothetical protein
MGRTIITQTDIDNGVMGKSQPDNYTDRLIKYIPAEIIAFYLALKPFFIKETPNVQWVIFAVLLVVTVVYLRLARGVGKWIQIIISVLAFAIWIFAIGGPFSELNWYNNHPVLQPLILGSFTILVPFYKPEQ